MVLSEISYPDLARVYLSEFSYRDWDHDIVIWLSAFIATLSESSYCYLVGIHRDRVESFSETWYCDWSPVIVTLSESLIVAVSESVSWPCLSLLIVTLIETCHRDLVCVLSSWLCLSPLIVTLSESYYPYQSKSSYCDCLLLWPCLSPLYCDLPESYYRDPSVICDLVCFLLSWSSHRELVCVLASWRCLSPLYCDLSESYYREPSITCDLVYVLPSWPVWDLSSWPV